jgi:glutamine synthetase
MLVLEYIWLDCNTDFRSKTKIMEVPQDFDKNTILNTLPVWNYDGSSTGQATGTDSEILMKPVAVFVDPFRKNENINLLVICDTYDKNMIALKNNHRPFAESTLEKYKEQEPWFGLEQEYFIMNTKTNLPLGFCHGEPAPQGNYYCSVGAGRAIGREVVEKHLEYCLKCYGEDNSLFSCSFVWV